MSLPRAYLAMKLTQPLPIRGGPVLRTVGEAANYVLELPQSQSGATPPRPGRRGRGEQAGEAGVVLWRPDLKAMEPWAFLAGDTGASWSAIPSRTRPSISSAAPP